MWWNFWKKGVAFLGFLGAIRGQQPDRPQLLNSSALVVYNPQGLLPLTTLTSTSSIHKPIQKEISLIASPDSIEYQAKEYYLRIKEKPYDVDQIAEFLVLIRPFVGVFNHFDVFNLNSKKVPYYFEELYERLKKSKNKSNKSKLLLEELKKTNIEWQIEMSKKIVDALPPQNDAELIEKSFLEIEKALYKNNKNQFSNINLQLFSILKSQPNNERALATQYFLLKKLSGVDNERIKTQSQFIIEKLMKIQASEGLHYTLSVISILDFTQKQFDYENNKELEKYVQMWQNRYIYNQYSLRIMMASEMQDLYFKLPTMSLEYVMFKKRYRLNFEGDLEILSQNFEASELHQPKAEKETPLGSAQFKDKTTDESSSLLFWLISGVISVGIILGLYYKFYRQSTRNIATKKSKSLPPKAKVHHLEPEQVHKKELIHQTIDNIADPLENLRKKMWRDLKDLLNLMSEKLTQFKLTEALREKEIIEFYLESLKPYKDKASLIKILTGHLEKILDVIIKESDEKPNKKPSVEDYSDAILSIKALNDIFTDKAQKLNHILAAKTENKSDQSQSMEKPQESMTQEDTHDNFSDHPVLPEISQPIINPGKQEQKQNNEKSSVSVKSSGAGRTSFWSMSKAEEQPSGVDTSELLANAKLHVEKISQYINDLRDIKLQDPIERDKLRCALFFHDVQYLYLLWRAVSEQKIIKEKNAQHYAKKMRHFIKHFPGVLNFSDIINFSLDIINIMPGEHDSNQRSLVDISDKLEKLFQKFNKLLPSSTRFYALEDCLSKIELLHKKLIQFLMSGSCSYDVLSGLIIEMGEYAEIIRNQYPNVWSADYFDVYRYALNKCVKIHNEITHAKTYDQDSEKIDKLVSLLKQFQGFNINLIINNHKDYCLDNIKALRNELSKFSYRDKIRELRDLFVQIGRYAQDIQTDDANLVKCIDFWKRRNKNDTYTLEEVDEMLKLSSDLTVIRGLGFQRSSGSV